MSISPFSLGDASIAQIASQSGNKKTPVKRMAQAVADQKLAPEPR